MNFIFHFYLAHFLADYVFQSSSLVKYKEKSCWGIFIHTFIHLAAMLMILWPFLTYERVWVAIGLIYFSHTMIDQTKIQLDKEKPDYTRFFYFLDQLIHWSIIYLALGYVGNLSPSFLSGMALDLFNNQTFFLYLLVMVLSTYFYDVTRYFIHFNPAKKKAFRRDYKTIVRNGAIVTLGFGIYWLAY